MALDNNHLLFSQQTLQFDWDPHYSCSSFGLGLGDVNNNAIMPPLDSPMSSETSTGYLQDAVAQWSGRCKRRRLAATNPCDAAMFTTEDIQDLLQGFWELTCYGDPLGNLNCSVEVNSNASGDHLQNSSSQVLPRELLPPPSSQMETMPETSDKQDTHNSKHLKPLRGKELDQEEGENKRKKKKKQKKKKKKKKKKIVYPFAVLKPVGLEGDVTLADINQRILMRPTRPVKHPVGEFAFRPCVSANGPGLSGRAVVGFTRIRTQGRGTITIIRTRG